MGRAVAVFGSSEPAPGDALYEAARSLGRLLAAGGYAVVTGGYGGVMAGASRGAREEGGVTVGVTCASFGDRRPNPYLSEVRQAPDLHERTRRLVEGAEAYVVLPGKSGTLAELTLLWALHRAGSLGPRPVVLWGAGWRAFLQFLVRHGMIENEQLAVTRVADTAEEAFEAVDTFFAGRP